MIIDAISDLHGHKPELEGGDLLIIGGDLTAKDTPFEYIIFMKWLSSLPYRKKILVGGNHDMHLQRKFPPQLIPKDTIYLRDKGTNFEGLKIWGSPWSPRFVGCSPKCKAFQHADKHLRFQWAKIPEDLDILITHTPPLGNLDGIPQEDGSLYHAGSLSLKKRMDKLETPPKIWLCGHIHEAYGEDIYPHEKICRMINISHVDEAYKPVNKPVRIFL